MMFQPKHIIAILLICAFAPYLRAQQPVQQLSSLPANAWQTVPDKDLGTVTLADGTIQLTADTNLYYICNQSPELSNLSLTYTIRSLNEDSHTGGLIRYISPNDWIYVGCDLTSDIFGYSAWYVETPHTRTEIARDIAKLYNGYTRTIQIDAIDESICLRIDNEIVAHVNLPGLPTQPGKVGLRAHQNGSAIFASVTCHPLTALASHTSQASLQIQSADLRLTLDKDFPTPLHYQWMQVEQVTANTLVYPYLTLNGHTYAATGTSRQINTQTILYTLQVPEVKVDIEVECRVQGHIFESNIRNIRESGDFKVYTIAFPQQYQATLPNTDKEAALSIALNEGSDRFFSLATKATDTIPRTAAIAILNNNRLAITLDNNSAYETKQFLYHTDKRHTAIGNNEWIYRGTDGQLTELPQWKVIFTADRNNDRVINWQDGAVALSEAYPDPYGVERVRNSFVTITMNFASEAQFPFLRQLDNIKKVYYLTDGFRQMLELKGYQAEGHDTGHPDYSGHYNTRAGGLTDLNTLVSEAKRYNAYIGLHINASEAHPAARAYHPNIVSAIPAWKWLDQAFLMNKENDVISGQFRQRLDLLKQEVPGLDFIYIDTYREHRYLAYNTARLFRERGWAAWTEDPSVFNRYGVWIHYHPESKSLISRFVHSHRKDAFAADSLFGGGYDRGASIGFQGWQNGKDMYRAIRNFYTNQLPYRYRMQSAVIYADSSLLRFRNGTEVHRKDGLTRMYANGQLIQSGDIVFIPWPQSAPEKVYHYNPEGGTTEWQLPPSWQGVNQVYCYALTDTGRVAAQHLSVSNHRITLNAKKDVPYVIYKSPALALLPPDWSHGSPVKDMGFDSRAFYHWEKVDDASGVNILRTDYGQSELHLTGRKQTGVTQQINGLKGGHHYSVYAWVQVNGNRKASLQVTAKGMKTTVSDICQTLLPNTQINSDKRGGYYQLICATVCLPETVNNAQLSLTAAAVKDTSSVIFDDVRWMEIIPTTKEGYLYYEDFEHVPFGWSGWMLSRASEAKIHLSERNDPYTDDVIDGNWSLKILDQAKGREVMRTMPSLIRFRPNHTYHLNFQYRSTDKGAFQVKVFSSATQQELYAADLDGEGTLQATFTTPKKEDCYIAIFQSDKGMLVIDNMGIREE